MLEFETVSWIQPNPIAVRIHDPTSHLSCISIPVKEDGAGRDGQPMRHTGGVLQEALSGGGIPGELYMGGCSAERLGNGRAVRVLRWVSMSSPVEENAALLFRSPVPPV